MAFAGERVEPPATAPVGRPRALQQTALFQAMQGRIDGSFRQVEDAVAAVAKASDDVVAVHRPARQHFEQQQLEVPFQLLVRHT